MEAQDRWTVRLEKAKGDEFAGNLRTFRVGRKRIAPHREKTPKPLGQLRYAFSQTGVHLLGTRMAWLR